MIAEFRLDTHLAKLGELIRRLRQYRDEIPRERFLSDQLAQDAILRNLQLATEACLTISDVLIAEYDLRKPDRAAELFTVLAEADILANDFAVKLTPMINFRNILVHDYLTITPDKAYDVLEHDLDDLETFRTQVSEFLRTQGSGELGSDQAK